MNPYKIDYIKSGKTTAETIILSGELSVNHIFSIRDELSDHINAHDNAEIIIKEVDIMDLSFVQLLISIKKLNPFITLKLQITNEQTDLLKVSGFYELLNH